MTENEKRALSNKLQLTEAKTRIEQIEGKLQDIRASQTEQATCITSAEEEIDTMLADLKVANTIVSNKISESNTTVQRKKLENFYVAPLTHVTDKNRDEYLISNGIDISGEMLTQFFSPNEIKSLLTIQDEINKEFSKRTSIINKSDLSFLAIAIALHTTKALVFPYIAEKLNYGNNFDANKRLAHDDPNIKKAQKEANDKFKETHSKSAPGYWTNILYQTPPYDITAGSPTIGYNMEGPYHRLHTLGHDPILGWVFGTANILTDIVTLDNFASYRVIRKPKMKITPESVSILSLFKESYDMIKADPLNLLAALFTQKQHYKSDAYTKLGLPVPLLETFVPEIAGKLYKEQYDALCLGRDLATISGSAIISILFNIIISATHGLFYNPTQDKSRDLYEVRTRKILLISNTIASTSNIIASCITKNPKGLDLGGLLVTISRLFSDIRFITKIKKEFIESELDKRIYNELQELGY